jgi:hypothetical protein
MRVVAVVDSEPVSDAAERLLRLLAGSTSSSFSWLLPSVIMSSAVSSSSAVRRPRLRVEDVGVSVSAAAVFVRVVLRCLLVDCFTLVFVLALVLAVVTLAVRDGDGLRGSEPIVAVVETLLNEEYVEVSLVVDLVDPMVAIVEVLRSAVGFGTLLVAKIEVGMNSCMLAIAYDLWSGLWFAEGAVEEEVAVGPRAAGICFVLDGVAPAGPPCTPGELLVPAAGLDEDEAAPVPRELGPPCSMSFHSGSLNALVRLPESCRPVLPCGATAPS